MGGSVFESDLNGREPTVMATGLRNAAFLAINPITEQLWGTEMGRDNLGDNVPPDEINIIKEGQNYGWPDCYGNKIPDKTFNRYANCTNTVSPIFEIPAHSAPLGLAFINSKQFPSSWQGDLLVALHGSWNRSTAIGYKVVHLIVRGDKITGSEDFMTGFNPGTQQNDSLGRPADVAFDKEGNLYISDDKAGVIYIVQKEE
jgi:glucose/arabinose dehydrogenase